MARKKQQPPTDEEIILAQSVITDYLLQFNEDKAIGDTPRAEQSLAMAMSVAARYRIPCKIYRSE